MDSYKYRCVAVTKIIPPKIGSEFHFLSHIKLTVSKYWSPPVNQESPSKTVLQALSELNQSVDHISTFWRIYQQTCLPRLLQMRYIQFIPPEYYTMLQISAYLYDTSEHPPEPFQSCLSEKEWSFVSITVFLSRYYNKMPLEQFYDEILKHSCDFNPIVILYCIQAISLEKNPVGLDLCLDQCLENKKICRPPEGNSGVFDSSDHPSEIFITLTQENIDHLICDPEGPFTSHHEHENKIYESLTGLNRFRLRYLLMEVLRDQALNGSENLQPASSEIIRWYLLHKDQNRTGPSAIQDLSSRLQKYPRKNWSTEQIQMKIQNLVIPTYLLDTFIQEYDKEYHECSMGKCKLEFEKFISIISILQPKKKITSIQTWTDVFVEISSDDFFEIPILSPKGLLLLSLHIVDIRLFKLLAYTLENTKGLFGVETGIFGLYKNGIVMAFKR